MKIKVTSQFSPTQLQDIENLGAQVFADSYRPNKFSKAVALKKDLLGLLAYDDTQLAGYKLGYPLSPGVFYSWLGGVSPSYQNQGVATQLMNRQHEIIKEAGYQIVRTKTRSSYTPMLILNLKLGFKINGTKVKEGVSDLIILMEKPL